MLENAFDDVSIDNDEESVCNGSPNNSTTNHSIFHNYSNLEFNGFKANVSNGLQSDLKNDDESNHIENFNGLHKQKPSKSNTVKRVDFNHDSQNYSNQCRKKIQNGNLHDIVDASGGGDTVLSLHLNHCIQRSPLGNLVFFLIKFLL